MKTTILIVLLCLFSIVNNSSLFAQTASTVGTENNNVFAFLVILSVLALVLLFAALYLYSQTKDIKKLQKRGMEQKKSGSGNI